MNCCPRPSASGNSSLGHQQHLGGYNFDCCTERYEIVVYCLNNGSILHRSVDVMISRNILPLFNMAHTCGARDICEIVKTSLFGRIS